MTSALRRIQNALTGRAVAGNKATATIARNASAAERRPDYEERLASRSLQAAQQYSRGDLAWAESVARDILKIEPDHIDSLNLLGLIASRMEYYSDAVNLFERVLQLDPEHSTAERSRQEALAFLRNPPQKASSGPRYLVIRAWGNGFWSDVTHVLGCLLLAEITGRTPVTYWDNRSRYSDGIATDAFRLYFRPVSALTIDDLESEGATYFPARLSLANLRAGLGEQRDGALRVAALYYLPRKETIAVSDFYIGVSHLVPWIPKTHVLFGKPMADIYRWLAEKYLHPDDRVLRDVDDFYRDQIAGRPTIAVHVRGLDKGREARWLGTQAPSLDSYFSVLDRESPSERIFLLSDDDAIIVAFRERYGERLIFASCQRSRGSIGLHYQKSFDPVQLGREVMKDVYLAMRCEKFLGMGLSNVSDIIAMLKPWPEGTCRLLGPSILRDVGLYRIKPKFSG